jgi:hypothetical protein
MESTFNRVVGRMRRVPLVREVELGLRRWLPAPIKRALRRFRQRMVMRSPQSFLSRMVTPGVENKLLSDPAVVDKLLSSDRGQEVMLHHASNNGRSIDWVAQVALNDPGAVVETLNELAHNYGHVGAALDRLAIERPPVMSEEQIVDIYLAQEAAERSQLWENPRVRAAFVDAVCNDARLADVRKDLIGRLENQSAAATPRS